MRSDAIFKNRNFFIYIFLASILLYACKENELSDPKANPPEMPPVATLQIEFNSFPTPSTLLKIGSNNSVQTSANWGWASFNGAVWQTLVTAGMIVPVKAFVESFNHSAIRESDGTWLWQYEFIPVTGIKYTASLKASVNNSGVIWEMYVSKENQFENFLWFSGKSDLLATEGTWTLFFEPSNPTPWIGIEWNRNLADATANIKYTNIVPGAPENGGYIFYGITTDDTYNAFYNIFNKVKKNVISIKWNTNSHIGSVRDSLHFGDYNWRCWDNYLNDVDCQ